MIPLFALIDAWTMAVVAIVVLLLFGNRLPSVMRSLGQGITEFKKGMDGQVENDAAKKPEPKKIDEEPPKG